MASELNTEQQPFSWPVRIYYEDTDAGGVVYHSNYLKFFERARTEMLRSSGINQNTLLEDNVAFVVRHMDIDFIRGARLDDELTVQTTISQLGRATIIFCQELVNSDNTVLCRASVKVGCVNLTVMRPISIPQHIKAEILRDR
ncbi:tol-pal system-associated acyl-CoA thioesterase [Parasalinivibrio latis]|uniref:tol-pal system-associated acyl-CoA thioesterase n=1 Tax=Parasalinivibrio latis TaxID=2952610 RepID=UPI0030E19B49